MIRGSVTEFSEAETGGGFSLGGGTSTMMGGVSPQYTKGHVTIDIRMIETNTGRIIQTETVDKKITNKALGVDVLRKDITFGSNVFDKTSLGAATREAIRESVALIVKNMEKVPWYALVARVRGKEVYINAGENANLRVGDTLSCLRTTEKIADPVTKEVLGVEEQEIGKVTIVKVAPRYSTAIFEGTLSPQTEDKICFPSQ